MKDRRKLERAVARGDREAEFRLFMDRVARGEIWIDARPLKGGELEDGDPDFEGDYRRMAGRPVLLIGYVASLGRPAAHLNQEDAVLAVVDDSPLPRIPRELGEHPIWRGKLVGPRPWLFGDTDAVFFIGPIYDFYTESSVHEIMGARRGEEWVVARWLAESYGWPSPSWFQKAMGEGFRLPFLVGDRVRLRDDIEVPGGHPVFPAGSTGTVIMLDVKDPGDLKITVRLDERQADEPDDLRWRSARIYDIESELELVRPAKRNPIDPLERRESLEPPSCPACAASWERFRTRRGGFWFMCRRHAEEARARRRTEAARRRVREIEWSGDPGWVFDPDAED